MDSLPIWLFESWYDIHATWRYDHWYHGMYVWPPDVMGLKICLCSHCSFILMKLNSILKRLHLFHPHLYIVSGTPESTEGSWSTGVLASAVVRHDCVWPHLKGEIAHVCALCYDLPPTLRGQHQTYRAAGNNCMGFVDKGATNGGRPKE